MPITDNFASGISASWTDLDGSWVADSGGVRAGEAFVTALLKRNGTFEDNQYSQCLTTVRRGGASASNGGAACRVQDISNYYAAYLKEDTGGGETITDIVLIKVVAGAQTQLGTFAITGGNFGDMHTVKINATGSTIKAYWDGVEKISVTDGALTTGAPGIFELSSADAGRMVDDFECEGTPTTDTTLGDAAARFWVLGQNTLYTRLARHYNAWSQRWPTVAADSFRGPNTDLFLTADSGHSWLQWTGDGGATPIPSVFRRYDQRMIPGRLVTATGVAWAGMAMGRADVTVRVRTLLVAAVGEGLGIAFRLGLSGKGWLFHYHSDGHWRVSTIAPSGSGNGFPPTINHEADLGTSPAFSTSVLTTLEVQAMGLTLVCKVGGTAVGSPVTLNSIGQYSTIHGIFCVGNRLNAFDNVTAWPHER